MKIKNQNFLKKPDVVSKNTFHRQSNPIPFLKPINIPKEHSRSLTTNSIKETKLDQIFLKPKFFIQNDKFKDQKLPIKNFLKLKNTSFDKKPTIKKALFNIPEKKQFLTKPSPKFQSQCTQTIQMIGIFFNYRGIISKNENTKNQFFSPTKDSKISKKAQDGKRSVELRTIEEVTEKPSSCTGRITRNARSSQIPTLSRKCLSLESYFHDPKVNTHKNSELRSESKSHPIYSLRSIEIDHLRLKSEIFIHKSNKIRRKQFDINEFQPDLKINDFEEENLKDFKNSFKIPTDIREDEKKVLKPSVNSLTLENLDSDSIQRRTIVQVINKRSKHEHEKEIPTNSSITDCNINDQVFPKNSFNHHFNGNRKSPVSNKFREKMSKSKNLNLLFSKKPKKSLKLNSIPMSKILNDSLFKIKKTALKLISNTESRKATFLPISKPKRFDFTKKRDSFQNPSQDFKYKNNPPLKIPCLEKLDIYKCSGTKQAEEKTKPNIGKNSVLEITRKNHFSLTLNVLVKFSERTIAKKELRDLKGLNSSTKCSDSLDKKQDNKCFAGVSDDLFKRQSKSKKGASISSRPINFNF